MDSTMGYTDSYFDDSGVGQIQSDASGPVDEPPQEVESFLDER
jgi:hypothetical protein